jgi:two-component system alkaline phosphatase synthesis response regulator PhoP
MDDPGQRYTNPMTMTVMIVEDELELAQVLRDYLEKAGFRALIYTDGQAARDAFRALAPDVVLLDLNLPGMDGLDLTREIRRTSDVPVLMVTARVEEADRLVGLELGADDYIVKPFSPREVVARVRAVLRRTRPSRSEPEILRAADVEVDGIRHRVTVSGNPVELTPTEFSLLQTLVAQPGRAFTRLQLLEAAQGDAYEGYERTVDAHIKNLRAKIESDPRSPRYIETVFGVGYRFRDE